MTSERKRTSAHRSVSHAAITPPAPRKRVSPPITPAQREERARIAAERSELAAVRAELGHGRGQARISEAAAKEIRRLHDTDPRLHSVRRLCIRFGVSESYMAAIIRGELHVTARPWLWRTVPRERYAETFRRLAAEARAKHDAVSAERYDRQAAAVEDVGQ